MSTVENENKQLPNPNPSIHLLKFVLNGVIGFIGIYVISQGQILGLLLIVLSAHYYHKDYNDLQEQSNQIIDHYLPGESPSFQK